jgi:hypothetical protein
MNRITSTTMRRLSPRTTVISGAALGLIAGATVYGAVSSSAQSPAPAAFKAKAPVAAKASLANCAAGAKLDKGVCVIHVVKTVVLPPSAAATTAAAHAAAAKAAGAIPASTVRSASANRTSGPESGEAGQKARADFEASKCSVVKTGEDSKDSDDASRSTSDGEDASRSTTRVPAPAPIACSAATPAAATPAAATPAAATPAAATPATLARVAAPAPAPVPAPAPSAAS